MQTGYGQKETGVLSGRISRFALLLGLCLCFGVLAENDSVISDTSERFNPNAAIQGTGWAQLYDPADNNLLLLPYVEIDGMAIYQGDIILGPAAAFKNYQITDSKIRQSAAIRSIRRRWDDGVLPYVVDAAFSSSQANRIRDAMDHIETLTSTRFVERAGQADYVNIVKTGGCSSFIGRSGGAQTLNLGGGCSDSLGVVVHELFHALGMYHEQSRSDRDNFVTINFANIESGFEHNFDKASNPIDVEIGPYDYDSVMHYGRFTFTRNGLETISVPNNQSIGNRSGLSSGDIEGMQYIYYTDLQLGLTLPGQVNPGASVAVAMTFVNQGDADTGDIIAKDVRLTLPLSSQSGYQGYSSSQGWQCALQGQSVVCTLAWLDRASTTDLIVNLSAPTNLNSMQLSPTVSASNRDPQLGNNNPSDTIVVNNLTDLAVAMAISRTDVSVGDPVEVSLSFSNTSLVDTQRVTLSLSAPDDLKYTGFSGIDWACSNVVTTTSCQLNNLAAMTASQLSINYTAATAVGNADIDATVSTQTTDGNNTNNSASASVKVNAPPAVSPVGSSGGSSSASAIDVFALLCLCILRLCRYAGRLTIPTRLQAGKIALLPMMITLGACQAQQVGSAQILYVDSKKIACSGLVPRQCLRVRHAENADWEFFYETINGFEYETGYRYKLSVQTSSLQDPPQDASSLQYDLLEVLEKNCVDC